VNFEKNGLTKEQQSLASFVASMSSKQSSGRTVFNNKKKSNQPDISKEIKKELSSIYALLESSKKKF